MGGETPCDRLRINFSSLLFIITIFSEKEKPQLQSVIEI